MASHHALARALARPDAWPEPLPPGTAFEIVETHISSLLMAGDSVLKLKKPVALPFVDFSSADRRHLFCDEELRLNRRTAPDLYRAVLPVLGPARKPRLGPPVEPGERPETPGDDEPIDWAVWMHRFDADGLFDRMADAGRLDASHTDALGDEIARLHGSLPPSPAGFGDPGHLMQWVADNLRELQALVPAGAAADAAASATRASARRSRMAGQVDALAAWSDARAAALRPLLAQRRAGGAVVEGHGDMHLGNIVWHEGRARLFDALEFAPDLRHGDRLADLAFPFMDLLDHGLPRLAWRLLARVLDASGDHDGLPLLRWLAAYRALVRAKVALLAAEKVNAAGDGDARAASQTSAHDVAERRVALAHALAHPAPPPMVLTCGLSGSGKSTVALMLAESLGALRVRSDVERKRLHGLAPTARIDDPARLYDADSTRRTYDRLLAIAQAALAGGIGVVLDAAYLRRAEREQARALAGRLGVPFAIVECRAPADVLAERIRRRLAADHDPSDADLAVLARQQTWREAPQADEPVHVIDSARPLPELDRAVGEWARAFASGPGTGTAAPAAGSGDDAPGGPSVASVA